jgi:hypothetical protein
MSDESVAMKYQAMELDADVKATYSVFKLWIDRYREANSSHTSLGGTPRKDQLLLMVALSCAGLFRVLDPNASPPIPHWANFIHPPAIVRRLNMLGIGQTCLEREGQGLFPKDHDMPIDEIGNQLEVNIGLAWGSTSELEYARQAWSAAPGHLSKLKEFAKTMASDLRRHSYTQIVSGEVFG